MASDTGLDGRCGDELGYRNRDATPACKQTRERGRNERTDSSVARMILGDDFLPPSSSACDGREDL